MSLPTPRRFLSGALRRPLHVTAVVAAAAALVVTAANSRTASPRAVDDCGSFCALDHGGTFMRAVDEYCRGAADPAAERAETLSLVRRAGLCFSVKMTPRQAADIIDRLHALPPGLLGDPDPLRYFTDGTVWTGTGLLNSANRAVAATLSYSFPADGTSWDGGSNVLNARFTTAHGAGNGDKGRELVRQAFASWRRYAGLNYTEVADNNSGLDNTTNHVTTRGDIRVGARSQDGASGVLAYDYFPTGGADMVLDADDFTGGNFNNSTTNYRFFRDVVSHEHGHGLAFYHSVPCDNTKLMEPFMPQPFDMVQLDEVRGAQRNHGDHFAGNNAAGTAADFGNLTTPVLKSIIEKSLSTNGSTGFNSSNQDWFRFTLGSVQNVVITVDPTGGTYTEGQQSSGCSGTTGAVVADQAGNLNLELRDSAGTTVLMSSAGAAAGVNEVITANSLAAGTYTIRVIDAGPNTVANQYVQLYDLTIRVGAAKAPSQAIAGVNKRVAANTTIYFMGNINSSVTEAGASITTYAWDLDGDGTYETANTAQPTHSYPANGVFPVSLRITDSNGMTDTDTILVTIFGGAGGVAVTSVSPNNGLQGATVPVTINGTALNNVDFASDVTVSGSGVTVIGTPTPNPGGTQVTGLSFVMGPAAATGARNVTVTTVDGTGTGTGVFTVNANTQPNIVSVAPNTGRQTFTVPVTITGANLGSVTAASQVTVSGAGVTTTGTPSVTPDGTTLTGVSFVVDAAAPSSTIYRSVSVSTPAGADTLTFGFLVKCLADWDGDSQITPSDVAVFVNNWSFDLSHGTFVADVDHDGFITPSDVAVYINAWFTALGSGCV